MSFIDSVTYAARTVWPMALVMPALLIPFIIAEQVRPVGERPGWRDYGLNILISFTTMFLALPAGVAAGLWGARIREALPWQPIAFGFDTIGRIPVAGGALEIFAMIFVPLIIHDGWFYWAHRLEHRIPFLWEFHKLHHSDERMNCSTWARDHFLQAAWIAFFPAFTLGMIFDIDAIQAGEAAIWSTLFLSLLSMFYHSAIRVRIPWLDKMIVTPQVHRLHHSRDPAHFNRNFADVLPVFDILFGTYRQPGRDESIATGLADDAAGHRSLWRAQVEPAMEGLAQLVRLPSR